MRYLLAAVLLISVQDPPPASLILAPPAGSKPADLDKAVAAFLKRCERFGFKGVAAGVVEQDGQKVAEVKCATGMTAEIRLKLKRLAYLANTKSVELHFTCELTDDEMRTGQYRSEGHPDKDPAPDVATWVRWHELHPQFPLTSRAIAVLTLKSPTLSGKDLEEAARLNPKAPGLSDYKVKLTRQGIERIRASESFKGRGTPSPVLVVDGRVYWQSFGNFEDWFVEKGKRSPGSFVVRADNDFTVIADFPMPFPLIEHVKK